MFLVFVQKKDTLRKLLFKESLVTLQKLLCNWSMSKLTLVNTKK